MDSVRVEGDSDETTLARMPSLVPSPTLTIDITLNTGNIYVCCNLLSGVE